MSSSRYFIWSGEGPTAHSYAHTRSARKQNLEYMRKAHRREQSWHRRSARAEFPTLETAWFLSTIRFTRQQLLCSVNQRKWRLHWSSKPAWPLAPNKFINHNTNHGRTDPGLKQINHGKIMGNIFAGDIHKTCGTHQSITFGCGHF